MKSFLPENLKEQEEELKRLRAEVSTSMDEDEVREIALNLIHHCLINLPSYYSSLRTIQEEHSKQLHQLKQKYELSLSNASKGKQGKP